MLAGLREKLNENPAMRFTVPGALILAFAVIVYSNSLHTSRFPPGLSDRAYFTTNDSAVGNDAINSLFVDSINQLPPFDHNGKPAFRAIVYKAGNVRWVNHLIRYLPAAKKKLEASGAERLQNGIKTGPDFASIGDMGTEVKLPGIGPWLKSSDPRFALVSMVRVPPGVQGSDVDIDTP